MSMQKFGIQTVLVFFIHELLLIKSTPEDCGKTTISEYI